MNVSAVAVSSPKSSFGRLRALPPSALRMNAMCARSWLPDDLRELPQLAGQGLAAERVGVEPFLHVLEQESEVQDLGVLGRRRAWSRRDRAAPRSRGPRPPRRRRRAALAPAARCASSVQALASLPFSGAERPRLSVSGPTGSAGAYQRPAGPMRTQPASRERGHQLPERLDQFLGRRLRLIHQRPLDRPGLPESRASRVARGRRHRAEAGPDVAGLPVDLAGPCASRPPPATELRAREAPSGRSGCCADGAGAGPAGRRAAGSNGFRRGSCGGARGARVGERHAGRGSASDGAGGGGRAGIGVGWGSAAGRGAPTAGVCAGGRGLALGGGRERAARRRAIPPALSPTANAATSADQDREHEAAVVTFARRRSGGRARAPRSGAASAWAPDPPGRRPPGRVRADTRPTAPRGSWSWAAATDTAGAAEARTPTTAITAAMCHQLCTQDSMVAQKRERPPIPSSSFGRGCRVSPRRHPRRIPRPLAMSEFDSFPEPAEPRSAPEDAGAVLLDRVEQRRDVGRGSCEVICVPAVIASGGEQPPTAARVVVAQPGDFEARPLGAERAGFHGGRRSRIVMLEPRTACSIR